jgi:hypothetical protein
MNEFSKLQHPYEKCKMQFPAPIIKAIEEDCGLTDEELDILKLRARGYSVLQISFIMEDKYGKNRLDGRYSDKTVERRIRSIKNKIVLYLREFKGLSER